MASFYTGDELGNIKKITCSRSSEDDSESWTFNDNVLYSPADLASANSGDENELKSVRKTIQKISLDNDGPHISLATATSDAQVHAFVLDDESGKLCCISSVKEKRMSLKERFVGLQVKSKAVFWCASNGAAGVQKLGASEDNIAAPTFISLPTRLRAWQLSDDACSFAYGGEEVDLSVWDCERALQGTGPSNHQDASVGTTKRKREAQLFPAEIWRAKNLPNDHLNLRQPIYITALSHLRSHNSLVSHLLATGTYDGHVRGYDTRAAKKPVANFTNLKLSGPVSNVCPGATEHELFVSDSGTNLCALDMRTGQKIYAYKKIQGTITGMCPAPGQLLGSTSQDRYFRLHSTFPPSETTGRNQEERGEVLGSQFMKCIPSAIVVDTSFTPVKVGKEKDEDDGDEIWDDLEDIDSDDNVERRNSRRRKV